MSRTSNRNKDTVEGQKAESVSSIGSEDEEEEMQDAAREETPDLYRNSALGMYGGVSGNFSGKVHCLTRYAGNGGRSFWGRRRDG